MPRLHHSVSAGHLSATGHRPLSVNGSASSAAFLGSKKGAVAAVAAAPVKKKDPYATAWRTYSKIAEELNLLNPDGSLYPISKEAILKYLHHQSKRIKSSNLHWYVNGLKKHQENLGFSWDEVRYDDQVLALLKELTLHPVPIESNLAHSGNFSNNSHSNGSTGLDPSARQRQTSGMTGSSYTQNNTGSNRTVSGVIDTARIATLSISDSHHSKYYSHQHPQQSYQAPFATATKRQQTPQYDETSSQSHQRQQAHQYSHGSQSYHSPPARATSYHSAPVQLPSHHPQDERTSQEVNIHRTKSHSYALGQATDAAPKSAGSSPMSSSELHIPQPLHPSIPGGSNVKRKRHDLVSERLARLASPANPEDEMYDEDNPSSRVIDQDERNTHLLEDADEDEDPSDRIALKRHASTGTLRSQARASAMSAESHPYQRRGEFSNREFPTMTPSPVARENDLNGGSHFRWDSSEALQSRISPPGSVSSVDSNSPMTRDAVGGGSVLSNQRHRRANGVVSSPISSVGSAATSSLASTVEAMTTSDSIPEVPGSKTTIQFSEVVEHAQQLQSQYGNCCKDHPWGCVELSEDHHLELTIKMYMDWAGLVASGRLTMDELPDLPDFRRSDASLEDVSSLSLSTSPTPNTSSGGTLKRMTSTPLTTTFGSFSISQQSRQRQASSTSSSVQRRQRSPSSSPTYGGHSPKEGSISDSLMSRIGSPPPQRAMPSPPSGALSPEPGGLAYNPSTRARKMASSPSLSRHFTFQSRQRLHSSHGGRSDSSSPPPVPPLPYVISPERYRPDPSVRNDHFLSTVSSLPGSTAPAPASREMDLSADEHEVEDADYPTELYTESTNLTGVRERARSQERKPLRETAGDGIRDDDEMEDADMEQGAFERHTLASHLKYENRSLMAWNGSQGGEKVRVGTKGFRTSSPSLSPSPVYKDSIGPMNSDPISTIAMTIMPNLQPRSHQQHHIEPQQDHLTRYEQVVDNHEDVSMEA
ncbi:hypothetical protein BGX28_001625 [Mortierella sp. GBA30]|nr:hypothetical protein BGX28_001625 [Mortierella sp. GBA30]